MLLFLHRNRKPKIVLTRDQIDEVQMFGAVLSTSKILFNIIHIKKDIFEINVTLTDRSIMEDPQSLPHIGKCLHTIIYTFPAYDFKKVKTHIPDRKGKY